MILDEYDSDPWLAEYIDLPVPLQRILRMIGSQRRFAVLDALADELGLRRKGLSAPTQELIEATINPVWVAVHDGRIDAPGRFLTLADAATRDLGTDHMIVAMVELGWGDTSLRNVSVKDVHGAIRKRLAKNLSHHIERMLRRWASNGLFAVASEPLPNHPSRI